MVFEEFIAFGAMLGGASVVTIIFFYSIIVKRLWPIRVPIMVQRGKAIIWTEDRAKYLKSKKGYEVLKLKSKKETIKPPKFEFLSVDNKGRPVYPIFNTAVGQYFPLKIQNTPSIEIVEDKSAKNWAILELQRTEDKYRHGESTLMRYMPYIMSATFAAMIIFFVIYFAGKIEGSSNALAGASNTLAAALTKFAPIGQTLTPIP